MKRSRLLAALAFALISIFARESLAADTPLSAVVAGGLYNATPTAAGFVPAGRGLTVNAKCAVISLPAYTETGSAGAEVLTGTGALPAANTDGVTTVDGDRVLVYFNETSFPDAGLFVKSTSSGNWRLTRDPSFATAALLQGSTIRVIDGLLKGIWLSRNPVIGAVGTDNLLWRRAGPQLRNVGSFRACTSFSDYASRIVDTANVTAGGATVSNGVQQYLGFLANAQGTAASITSDTTSAGDGRFTTGTQSTGLTQLTTLPIDPTVTRYEGEIYARFSVPTLNSLGATNASDGTNNYTVSFGFTDGTVNNFSRLAFAPSAGGIALNHVTTIAGVAGTTRQLCASCFAFGTTYQYLLIKVFGASVWQIWFDPGTGALAYVADTPALPTSVQINVSDLKALGTLHRQVLVSDFCVEINDPKL